MPEGRWPANVILSPAIAETLDKQSGNTGGGLRKGYNYTRENSVYGKDPRSTVNTENTYGDSGGASRFFLTAGYEPWELDWITANGLTPVGE